MTRYLNWWRIVGLAGLVSVALSTLPAAPARARLVCPPGTTNPKYCKTVLTLSVTVKIQGGRVTVTIHVTDPHLKVTLSHKGKVTTLFNHNASGKVTIRFRTPTDPGTYNVKAVATTGHITKTVIKHFTIPKHKKHK